MVDVIEIAGGYGVPPEPNWRSIFPPDADREAASSYWKSIISETRGAEKLAVANSHAVIRLVVAYVTFDQSAKEVIKSGRVIKERRPASRRTIHGGRQCRTPRVKRRLWRKSIASHPGNVARARR